MSNREPDYAVAVVGAGAAGAALALVLARQGVKTATYRRGDARQSLRLSRGGRSLDRANEGLARTGTPPDD
ncbi:FAD-dependent monooxygenase [Rhodoblastus acidophilus]|uniref:FAD-dependent monooxygenase n=1 Tax=Candidatus Rhodoblastus alkanivorans TaxID=2954117 RepID=A0ABS9Z698_9HYPH|nr:FAD-dependent monooxygenase [Candidatus Rhodoblastus alkanivorans]MCI4678422.1 FAD-dependent monooxygenase [Candidatus Rhodoblastus alkanivorans]MCI4682905.1 FAD-dependent monooxygenase [Candidatus Rhodoblastus alkanivorans]MDI4640215.1 FAD-dependent monooxygenase [Rhodoblastus acidophilus]